MAPLEIGENNAAPRDVTLDAILEPAFYCLPNVDMRFQRQCRALRWCLPTDGRAADIESYIPCSKIIDYVTPAKAEDIRKAMCHQLQNKDRTQSCCNSCLKRTNSSNCCASLLPVKRTQMCEAPADVNSPRQSIAPAELPAKQYCWRRMVSPDVR